MEGWSRAEGVAVDLGTYAQLAGLSKAAAEPELTKRRTFYSGSNRADVETAMQRLHQALGLFMEGAVSMDADKDQRDNTLTGQDAPAPGDTPGGPGTAPHDGVSGDGNLAYDPAMVRDGDPAIRTPDGQRDGRAQGEAGTHTGPPAGDAPGPGPGDQGQGQPPPGKGRQPDPQQAQQSPGKAAKAQKAKVKAQKGLRKAKAELAELRKGASGGGGGGGHPAIALQQTLGSTKPAKQRAGRSAKGLREEIKGLGQELRRSLEDQRAAAPGTDAAKAAERLEKRIQRRLRKMSKRLDRAATADPTPDPLAERIDALTKAVTAAAARPAADGAPQAIDSSLLLADLTRAAYEQTRKDLTEQATWLGKRVKRVRQGLRKAAEADRKQLQKMASDLEALGRLPHPGGAIVARPTDKSFPINDSIERSVSPDVLKRMQILKEMSESSDRQVAAEASGDLRKLMAEVRG